MFVILGAAMLLVIATGFRLRSSPFEQAQQALSANQLPAAVALLGKAAASGDVRASMALGEIYLDGKLGFPDYQRAKTYFRQALSKDSDDVIASRRLAEATASELIGNWGLNGDCTGDVVSLWVSVDKARSADAGAPYRKLYLIGSAPHAEGIAGMIGKRILTADGTAPVEYELTDTGLIRNPGTSAAQRMTRCQHSAG
jgi:hypothetical protein